MFPREIALLVLATFGAMTDASNGKIYNALTYPTCAFGLALGLAESGGSGFLHSLSGLAFAFVPFFSLYLCGGLGGGDVKMMAAVGALMGLEFTALVMVHSIFAGALLAILLVIWHGQIRETLSYLVGIFAWLALGRSKPPELHTGIQVPFGVAIGIASFSTLVASWRGAPSPWHLIDGLPHP